VRASRAEYRRASDALAPFKRILDVYVSKWFAPTRTLPRKRGRAGEGVEPTIEFLRGPNVKAWLDDPTKGIKKLTPEMKKVAETTLQAARDKHFFHWELEFPEVFFGPAAGTTQVIELKESGGFDAVVGNPPYDELSEDALGRDIPERDFLIESSFYEPARESGGRLNWYHFFMLMSIAVLRPGSRSGFIVPMSWVGDSFTSGVRHWLLDNHRPLSIDCFPQKDDPKRRVFPEAKLPTSIFVTQKDRRSGDMLVRVHPGRDILDLPYYAADVDILRRLNSEILLIPVVSKIGWDILKKVATAKNLGSLAEVAAEPTSGEIIFNEANRRYMTEDDSYDLILRGSHIQRYELEEFARQGEPIYLKTKEYLSASQNDSKAYDHRKPRVVYQEGSAIDAWRRVVPTYLPAGYICGHKICYFVNYKIDPLALLAVYASKLTNWLVESLSATNSLPAYLIGGLPFPKFSITTPAARRKALVEQGRQLCEAADPSGLLAFVEARLSARPEESDVVHDLLAFLAEQMINLNKRKQAEQKRFLGWLEGVLKISPDRKGNTGLDALTGKSRLRNYLGDYQKGEPELPYEELEDILFKNKTRLGISLSDTRFTARLRAEYDKSLAVLRPIKAQLARTDALIDQVVYRLYGLSEDEIAVVEGKR